jgi:hypothetical protein
MNSIVMLPFNKITLSAGIPLTVRSLAWTVAGSTDSLRLIMKSVGWLNTTLGQAEVTEQGVGVGVGVAVGVAVGVGITVAVGVGVGPAGQLVSIELNGVPSDA